MQRRAGAPVETFKFVRAELNAYPLTFIQLGHGIVDHFSRSVTLDKFTRSSSLVSFYFHFLIIQLTCVDIHRMLQAVRPNEYSAARCPRDRVRQQRYTLALLMFLYRIHLQKLDNEREDDLDGMIYRTAVRY